MRCDEARELFSALVDEALSPEERGVLDAHLAGCADCHRELEGFRQTVALVRSASPLRAPVGFVDRVLAASRPAPWYRRLARRLFVPLPLKLPIEAAAVVVVAIFAVYLYRETPELQRAAREEARPPAVSEAPPSAHPPPRPPTAATSGPSGEKPPEPPERSRAERTDRAQRKEGAADSRSAELDLQKPAESKNVIKDDRLSGKSTTVLESAPAARQLEPAHPPASPPPAATAPTSAEKLPAPAAKSRAESTDRPQGNEGAVGLRSAERDVQKPEERKSLMKDDRGSGERPPALEAPPAARQFGSTGALQPRAADQAAQEKRAAAPVPGAAAPYAVLSAAEVAGRLAVTDRAAAETALAALAARLGGAVLGTRTDADTTIVELRVPRAAYADFLQGLAHIGRWTPEREAGELPDHVRVTLRLSA